MKEVDNKEVRLVIYEFFALGVGDNGVDILRTITRVSVFLVHEDKIYIDIESHRPGLIIGKAGKLINELVSELERQLAKQVKINLKECTLWNDIF